ncbi:response regulator [Tessaracoccus sp.]
MKVPPPIRVAVLDDHEFILRAVAVAADMSDGRITLTRTASAKQELIDHCREERPDVVIVDLVMDGRISGHQVIDMLSSESFRCLAFTAEQRRLPIRLAMQAGARGLVLKSDPMSTLVQAIIDTHEEGWASSSSAASALLDDSTHLPALSPHELKCLRLAAEGIPIKAIGRQFEPPISLGSVKTYLARAYEKYADAGRPVRNTTEAAINTLQDGWFDA